MERSKIAVIGLGNYLLGDEGAGLHAIELLQKKRFRSKVDLIDAGTPGMNLLHQFEEREKIIFIDSGNCSLKPGEFIRFRPEEVKNLKKPKNFSLHEFDLISFLESSVTLEKRKKTDIVIYCIQAEEVKMTMTPSLRVQKNLPKLIEQIYLEIEEGVQSNA